MASQPHSPQRHERSYSNPAFCQQSEYYPQQQGTLRRSPVGAQQQVVLQEAPRPGPKPRRYTEEEQEFYEEVIVDGRGAVRDRKTVMLHNSAEGKRYEAQQQQQPQQRFTKARYEYIPMLEQQQQQEVMPTSPAVPRRVQYHEEVEASTGVIHRYAVIAENPSPPPPPPLPKPSSGRYALVPVEEVQDKSRYALITASPTQQQQQETSHRYDYVDRKPQPNAATQKLHEFLTTPKKPPCRFATSSPNRVVSPARPQPRAQQKLNYAIATRHGTPEKRSTAIVAPICSSPVQSVYSETTYSKDSWSSSAGKRCAVQTPLAVAAFMMVLCGSVTTGLCFYMMSDMGRLYFLDFGVIAGFTCMLLGLLGFRSRNIYWLPNRNYISGYFILSIFSLLACAGLLVLLFMRPKPGTALADMTSGAVCGISGLSLLLAGSGVVASYCCKVPPPDNRVQHCAQGFSV